MRVDSQRLDSRVLAAANTVETLFPAAMRTEITRIMAVNVATSAVIIDIYHTPRDATRSNSHIVIKTKLKSTLADGETQGAITEAMSSGSGITLAPGDKLEARASVASAAVLTVYGVTENIADTFS